MPRNTEVQARLVRTASELTTTASVQLDREAQDRLGELIAAAADRIEQEDRLDDPEALAAAEDALQKLIRRAAIEQRRGSVERRGGAYQQVPRVSLNEAALDEALRGLCPLWPIC